jgi:predicted CXXCH cytochrome family protein
MRAQPLHIAAILLFAGSAACGASRRHAVLDFFFDGVPPLVDASADSAGVTSAEAAAGEEEKDTKAPTVYEHPPSAEGLCELCHSLEGKTFAGNTDLVLPVTELCYQCHDDFEPEPLREEGNWLHGPFAAGQCVACHGPHKTAYPTLLKHAPREEICGRCHREEDLRPAAGAGHGKPDSPPCIDCHDPHYGPARYVARSPGEATEGGAR